MKPLIGITTGEMVNRIEPWAPYSYGQTHYYSDAVIAAGGVPILIPFMPDEALRQVYERLDGVLFAGGNDIDPRLYGEEPRPYTVDVSEGRDRQEATLLDWVIADNKPLLAICRGMQLLNVHLGGALYQDLTHEMPGADNHVLSTHRQDGTFIAHHLRVAPDSKMAQIISADRIDANSHHHQGIKTLAHGLRAVAWSEDGLIEAIEHSNLGFGVGVQCHPESLSVTDEKWAAAFRAFVIAAAQH